MEPIRIIAVEPTGMRSAVAHINRGDQPHAWGEVETPTYPDEHTAYGRAVRDARVSAGLTLRELARKLGISPADLSGIERGSHATDDAGHDAICEAVGMRVRRDGAVRVVEPPRCNGTGDGTHCNHWWDAIGACCWCGDDGEDETPCKPTQGQRKKGRR